MHSFIGVTVLLQFFVAVSWGRETYEDKAEKSCKFPHKGDGGILDQNLGYINDSSLAWIDVAENCHRYATDPRGSDALNELIDVAYKFDTAMKSNDADESFKLLHKANETFKTVAPFIGKSDLSMYFMKVYEEFEALLKTKNLKDINEYMIGAYSQFKEKLGC